MKLNSTKIPDQTINLMASLYNSGNSITDISKLTDIGVSQVWRMLKKNNVNTKKTVFFYRSKIRKYWINEEYFQNIDTPDKAYILGLLYADGNANKRFSQITLKLQEKDKHILEEINQLLEHAKPLIFDKKCKNTHQNKYILKITNKVMYKDLIKYGVIPNKTFKLTFPTWLKDELISHFVRGYFDGDGCLYLNKKTKAVAWEIMGTSQFCLILSEFLCQKMNVKSNISHDRRCRSGIDRLRVRNYPGIKKICTWMYNNSTLHLERKYNKFLQIKEIKNDFV